VTIDGVDLSVFKSAYDTHLTADSHTQYVHNTVARTISAVHTFNPGSAGAPFSLGANATGQLVTGLNADTVDGVHGSALIAPSYVTLGTDATLTNERVLTAGAGLTGADGGAGSTFTLNVGAGAGISVAADSVAVDVTASFTWTGTHAFQGTLTTRTITPEATDTYDLGSSTKLWRKGWLAELDAVVFAQNTVTLLGGWFLITKNEVTLPADVTAGATTVNFGQSMTVGDFVLFRAAGAVEYMSVGSLVSGTTYNVTRNLDGSGANAWAAGAPGAVLGQTGNGRIELNAYDSPRISIIKQGATYNAQTETLRLGDLNGSYGIASELYGIGIGDYSGGNYLRYDPTNGFRVKAGNGGMSIDSSGIVLASSATALLQWAYANGTPGMLEILSSEGGGTLTNGTRITGRGAYGHQILIEGFNTNDSTKYASLTVNSYDGTVDISCGLNVGTATGAADGDIKVQGGITFGSGSKLSTYSESGTWTPAFTGLTLGAGTAPTYAGTYTRVGNLVYFIVTITPGTATTASTAATTYINNLPFTASKNSTLTVTNNVVGNIGVGYIGSGTTWAFTPTWGATSGVMTISGCYLA
jgi:hypothetical protein